MRVISSLERITGDVARIASARSIGDVMQDTLTALERRQQAHQRGECVGISTGLPCMDRITGGWRGGQLVILAARPAMGKTAVALHFAQAAAGAGVPVCIFFAGDARDAARRPYAGWCFGCGCEGVPVWCGKYRGLEAHRTGSGPVGRVARDDNRYPLYFDARYSGAVPGVATAGAVRYGRYRLFAADGPRF